MRKLSPIGALVLAFGSAGAPLACSGARDASDSGDQASTTTPENFWTNLQTKLARIADAVAGPDSWTAPDAENAWAKGFVPTRVGEENVLDGEDATFAKLAGQIQDIQMSDADSARDEATCNSLSWNPWHGVLEHRPLGNIMRVRREVLAASAEKRDAKSLDPSGPPR